MSQATSLADIETELFTASPDTNRLLSILAEEYAITPHDAVKLLYKIVQRLNARWFPPLTQLELVHTEGCNLACHYCFEKDMLGFRRMPLEVAYRAIDILFDYSGGADDLTITHFGGEPTLNFSGIRAATEYAEGRAAREGKTLRFDMTSNGVLLTEEMVDYFAEHEIQVLLSIDGMQQSHDRFRVDKRGRGSFERVMRGLQLLQTRQPWIGVKLTVMPENAGALLEDVYQLRQLGINHFIIGHASGVPWDASAMESYADQLTKVHRWCAEQPASDLRINGLDREDDDAFFGCQAGRSSIAVSVQGEVSPCSKIMGFDSRNLIGKLGDVWQGLTHLRNRRDLVGCSELEEACEEQGIAKDFRGGCFAVNYGEFGDLFQPSLLEHRFSLLERAACVGCPGCSH